MVDLRPRTSEDGGYSSGFGLTKLCLLVSFVVLSIVTYLYLDTGHMTTFLMMLQNDPGGTAHVFLLFYTLAVVLLFPCMILQVVSGALYGFWVGMLVSWVATSLGQSLAFLLGRYLFRAPVKSYLHQTWPSFPTIDAAIKQEGWKLVCLLRLSPVLPYNILNYALALTPVSFVTFSVASAVATIPWTALYVYIGTFSTDLMALAHGKISYGENMPMVRSVLSMGFMVVTTVYGYIWSHRAITAVFKDVAKAEQEMRDREAPTRNGSTGSPIERGAGDEEAPRMDTFAANGDIASSAHHRHSLSPTGSVKEETWPMLGVKTDRVRG